MSNQPEPTDEPAEYLGPTPPPKPHACDEDCHPFLTGDDRECQECQVCGVTHGDPCAECGGRGYHDPDCSEVMEPRDIEEEMAAHGDYLYDQMKDDRLCNPERYP